jgi:hypothetical protein
VTTMVKQATGTYKKHRANCLALLKPHPKAATWTTPPPNLLKLKFDATIKEEFIIMSGICKNHRGSIFTHGQENGPPLNHTINEAKATI